MVCISISFIFPKTNSLYPTGIPLVNLVTLASPRLSVVRARYRARARVSKRGGEK